MNCGMGKPSGIENFRVFGSECFAHIPAKTRRELDKKGRKGYLLGYLDEGQGFRVHVPSCNIQRRRNI